MPIITLCANVSYLHVSDLHLVGGESLIIQDESIFITSLFEPCTRRGQYQRLMFTTSIFCHQNNTEAPMFNCFCNFLLLGTTEIL